MSTVFRRKKKALQKSARDRGLACTVKTLDLVRALRDYPACPCCGRAYNTEDAGGPQTWSVDRVDPFKGYVPDNIQILCVPCNLAKDRKVGPRYRKMAEWHSAASDLWVRPDLTADLV